MAPLFTLLLACAAETPTAAVRFLAPRDGDVLTAGETRVSLLVEGFSLVTPVHNAGTPEGYVQLRVDGVDTLQAGGTQVDLALEPGERTLEAELFYVDGDPLDPPTTGSVRVTVQ
jgi:hypothetical protein